MPDQHGARPRRNPAPRHPTRGYLRTPRRPNIDLHPNEIGRSRSRSNRIQSLVLQIRRVKRWHRTCEPANLRTCEPIHEMLGLAAGMVKPRAPDSQPNKSGLLAGPGNRALCRAAGQFASNATGRLSGRRCDQSKLHFERHNIATGLGRVRIVSDWRLLELLAGGRGKVTQVACGGLRMRSPRRVARTTMRGLTRFRSAARPRCVRRSGCAPARRAAPTGYDPP